jgi:lipopolysaccharide export system protein LptA
MTLAQTGGKLGGKVGGRTAAGRRSRGLWTAVALATGVALLVGFFAVRSAFTGGPRRTEAADIPAQDITILPDQGPTGPTGRPLGGRAITIQMEDPDDPARLKGELHAAELEPQEGHRYLVKEPEAWLYLRNGWMLYVRADSGSFYIPDDKKQPERGILQGAVRCEGFPPGENGEPLTRATMSRDSDAPSIIARTASLTFDSTLGTLSTDDRVEVTGDEIDFAGRGLSLAVNQVREQINMLDVAHGEWIKYRPKAAPRGARIGDAVPRPSTPAKPAPPRPAPAPGAKAGSGPKAPAPGPITTLYHAQFRQGVQVASGGRTVSADALDVWTRLIGNALPENAIADVPVASAEPVRPVTANIRAVSRQPAALPNTAAAPAKPDDDPANDPALEEIVLTWSGPLQVRPVEAEPEELKSDHVFMRFTARQTGLVHLADAARKMSGQCALLQYGATTRRLSLEGPGPASVVLRSDQYEAHAVRIEADLGLGIAAVPGPGIGRDLASGEQGSWAERADFVFRIETDPATGEERLAGIRSALFRGKAALANADITASAESIRAEFLAGDQGQSNLDHVFFKENVRAGDGRSRQIGCDEMTLAFKPGENAQRPEPTSLTATGNITASDGPSTLTAGELHARLERAEDGGGVTVTWAEVKGGAHFVQDDRVRPRVEADALELDVDPKTRIVNLLAADGQAARVVRGGAILTGPQVRLDGLANGAWVVGPGSFVNGPDKRSPEGPRISAAWTREMRFSDTEGVLEASGAVTAEIALDPMSLDKVAAGRLRLDLTPGRAASESDQSEPNLPAGPDSIAADAQVQDRTLIRARAEGEVREVSGGANASVESWRYAPDAAAPGGRRPDRVMFLEGPLIVASQTEGFLDVEGQGRLLVVDRRYFESAAPAPESNQGGLGARMTEGSVGGSLFSWSGSMHLERQAGTIRFLERVRLNHKPQRDASLMELECEDLMAQIRQPAGKGAQPSAVDGELESVDARGAVWGRSTTRELIADRLYYDAVAGRAEATAADGNRVSMFDRARATTMTAGKFLWDLTRDSIEVVDPGTVTTPR